MAGRIFPYSLVLCCLIVPCNVINKQIKKSRFLNINNKKQGILGGGYFNEKHEKCLIQLIAYRVLLDPMKKGKINRKKNVQIVKLKVNQATKTKQHRVG